MKKLSLVYKFSFFALTAAAFCFFSNSVQAVTLGKYLENTRVRKTPSLTSAILEVLPAKTGVTILEEQGDWYKVQTDQGIMGWSMKAYIQKENPSPKPAEASENHIKESEVGSLLFNSRIRKTPSLENNIIEVLPEGSRVKILEAQKEWYHVEYGSSKTGWVMAELVKKGEESESQETHVPEGVDLSELNRYWLEKINGLRAKKDLRQLVLDERWVDTATEWAGVMGEKGVATHTRSDGKSMHQWIDTKGLDFTTRYSEDGWQTNYFTENIAWGISQGTTDDVKKVLDNTLAFFLSEASYNGDHYRTIYHKDWNSVGLGFYFQDIGKEKYKVFVAMHYGSLELK